MATSFRRILEILETHEIMLVKETPEGLSFLKIQDEINFFEEVSIPVYLSWTEAEIAKSWSNPLIIPRGLGWRMAIFPPMKRRLNQERGMMLGVVDHPPFRFEALELPFEIPLLSIRRIMSVGVRPLNYLVTVPPTTQEVSMFIRSFKSSEPRILRQELVFIPSDIPEFSIDENRKLATDGAMESFRGSSGPKGQQS